MAGFDDRENRFENKFAHDNEVQFKIRARRNKLFGKWASEQMHFDAEKTEEYAKTLVQEAVLGEKDVTVFEKVKTDFSAAGIEIEDTEIKRVMEDLYNEAVKQLEAE